ncbi:hypothetical protein L484_013044 [Morus notabilis]|uniref:Uncharacterized protein n=1 Tax=Morus notabilis TaxID=981085 RepID=W9SA85_9ROSA|nr:hypothetical protein L484_013044 [Morus notabilis]
MLKDKRDSSIREASAVSKTRSKSTRKIPDQGDPWSLDASIALAGAADRSLKMAFPIDCTAVAIDADPKGFDAFGHS